MASFRYFRLIAIEAFGRGDLEIAELQLGAAGSRVDGSATLTVSSVPSVGSVTNIKDADLATSARWTAAQLAGVFSFLWDFGTATTVSQFRVAGVTKSRALARTALQGSTNALSWTTLYNFDTIAYPGDNTYTPWVDFEAVPSGTVVIPFDGANGSVSTQMHSQGGISSPVFFGAAAITTAQSKYGGAALQLGTTTGNFVRIGNDSRIKNDPVLANKFTTATPFGIEFEVFITARNPNGGRLICACGGVAGYNSTTGIHWLLQSDAATGLNFQWWTGSAMATITGAFATGAWIPGEVSFDGTTMRMFNNGALVASLATTFTAPSATPFTDVGAIPGEGALTMYAFSGLIDDIRLTAGSAPHTAAFTPATTPKAIPQGIELPDYATRSGALQVAFQNPNLLPITINSEGKPIRARDHYFGGRGYITGTVKEKGSPTDLPVMRKVRLFRDRDGLFIRETFSDAITGAYAFVDIDPSYGYSVISYDVNNNFRAVIADKITPAVS